LNWPEDETVQIALRGIMDAFRTSTLETVILLVAIAGFIAFVVLIFILQKRKSDRKKREYAEGVFREKVEEKDLKAVEINVLERMAEELPGGRLRKHVLVTDENAYDRAAYNLIHEDVVSEELAAAIRLKLGFEHAAEDEAVYTTAELPKGKHLYLVDGYGNRSHALLDDLTPDAVFLKVNTVKSDMPAGGKLRVYFRQKSGVYTFITRVIQTHDDIIACTHSDKIKREQRRDYYRKEVEEKIAVEGMKPGASNSFNAKTYDLGGGGAKLENPERRFGSGDTLLLTLPVDSEETLQVRGDVVKTSRDDNILHVQFKNISEAERDKIIGYIFTH
jgi:c-di-GMP-binding flagellar brake protein YcgR